MCMKSYGAFVYARTSCHGQRTHAMEKHQLVQKFWCKFTISFRKNKQNNRINFTKLKNNKGKILRTKPMSYNSNKTSKRTNG